MVQLFFLFSFAFYILLWSPNILIASDLIILSKPILDNKTIISVGFELNSNEMASAKSSFIFSENENTFFSNMYVFNVIIEIEGEKHYFERNFFPGGNKNVMKRNIDETKKLTIDVCLLNLQIDLDAKNCSMIFWEENINDISIIEILEKLAENDLLLNEKQIVVDKNDIQFKNLNNKTTNKSDKEIRKQIYSNSGIIEHSENLYILYNIETSQRTRFVDIKSNLNSDTHTLKKPTLKIEYKNMEGTSPPSNIILQYIENDLIVSPNMRNIKFIPIINEKYSFYIDKIDSDVEILSLKLSKNKYFNDTNALRLVCNSDKEVETLLLERRKNIKMIQKNIHISLDLDNCITHFIIAIDNSNKIKNTVLNSVCFENNLFKANNLKIISDDQICIKYKGFFPLEVDRLYFNETDYYKVSNKIQTDLINPTWYPNFKRSTIYANFSEYTDNDSEVLEEFKYFINTKKNNISLSDGLLKLTLECKENQFYFRYPIYTKKLYDYELTVPDYLKIMTNEFVSLKEDNEINFTLKLDEHKKRKFSPIYVLNDSYLTDDISKTEIEVSLDSKNYPNFINEPLRKFDDYVYLITDSSIKYKFDVHFPKNNYYTFIKYDYSNQNQIILYLDYIYTNTININVLPENKLFEYLKPEKIQISYYNSDLASFKQMEIDNGSKFEKIKKFGDSYELKLLNQDQIWWEPLDVDRIGYDDDFFYLRRRGSLLEHSVTIYPRGVDINNQIIIPYNIKEIGDSMFTHHDSLEIGPEQLTGKNTISIWWPETLYSEEQSTLIFTKPSGFDITIKDENNNRPFDEEELQISFSDTGKNFVLELVPIPPIHCIFIDVASEPVNREWIEKAIIDICNKYPQKFFIFLTNGSVNIETNEISKVQELINSMYNFPFAGTRIFHDFNLMMDSFKNSSLKTSRFKYRIHLILSEQSFNFLNWDVNSFKKILDSYHIKPEDIWIYHSSDQEFKMSNQLRINIVNVHGAQSELLNLTYKKE